MSSKEKATLIFLLLILLLAPAYYFYADTRCDMACLEDSREAELHLTPVGTACWCFDNENRAYRPGR